MTAGSPKGQLIQFTCRLSKGQAQVLQYVAEKENLGISELMRNVITESLTSGYLSRKFGFALNIPAGAGEGPPKKKK